MYTARYFSFHQLNSIFKKFERIFDSPNKTIENHIEMWCAIHSIFYVDNWNWNSYGVSVISTARYHRKWTTSKFYRNHISNDKLNSKSDLSRCYIALYILIKIHKFIRAQFSAKCRVNSRWSSICTIRALSRMDVWSMVNERSEQLTPAALYRFREAKNIFGINFYDTKHVCGRRARLIFGIFFFQPYMCAK